MTDNDGTDLNLSNFHIKQECSAASVKIKDVDDEEIITMETEVVGGSVVHTNFEEVQIKMEEPQNENVDSNLELGANAVEQLLNKNSGEECENCKMESKNYCRNCKDLQSIPKTILEIKGSLVEGYGVYALKSIPKGVKFGPYEGLETVKRRNKYLWKIRYAKLMEATGEDCCNWMRFINCTSTQTEQNMIALQFMGKIYYKALKEIKTGEELLIYYSNSRSKHPLGLCSIRYLQPEIQEINEGTFKCLPCCFEFSAEKYLVKHIRVCPFKKEKSLEANGSTDIKDFEGHPKMCKRINNLSSDLQKDKENGKVDEGKKGFQQDCMEHMKINDKEEELKFCHNSDESHCVYVCGVPKETSFLPTKEEYECNYIANELTLKRYQCNECSYAAVQKSHLLYHVKSYHTKEKPFKCNECSYATVRKDVLLIHIKSRHTMEKPYKCNDCSYSVTQKAHLLTHIQSRHTMEKPYKCTECSYAATQKGHLLTHIKSRHTMERPYKCNDCSYSTARKNYLLIHIKSHHTMEKHHRCNECSYAAVRKGDLLTHIKSRHTVEKPYKCNECSYAATRKYALLMHIKCCHTMNKSYKCNECSYATVQKSHLLNHIKSRHAMEKPHKCNECTYAATLKRSLLHHIKSHHTIEKPYKCNECSYTAVRKDCLLTHIKSHHSIEKPYKCDECSYAVALKGSLLSHIKHCHTIEKPFKCNECSYAAVQKSNLLNHIKSRHAIEKPHKCSECSYAATLKRSLLHHIQSYHTMEKPYKCNECTYATVQKVKLLYHIKSRHTMEKT